MASQNQIVQKIITDPTEATSQRLSNFSMYLNQTDGHYYIRATVTSLLPETTIGAFIGVLFVDTATGTPIRAHVGGENGVIVKPGSSRIVDADTGYTVADTAELKHMTAIIN
jgi:hypothetical protein